MKHLLFCFLISLSLPGDWLEFRSDTFEMSYPPNWNFYKNEFVKGNFSWTSPLSGKSDGFSENVNVLIQDLSGLGITLDKYVEISREQINTLDNISILKSKREKYSKGEYQVIHYTYYRAPLKLYVVQHYYILQEKAYILTFTAEQKSYADYRDTGLKILNSFRFN